ncbi:MAG: anthranilate synthase component I [Bacillota bacterium]
MDNPSLADYQRLSNEYNVIPVTSEYFADTQTPITVFQKVSAGRPAFLLESVEGGERLARYSFIGVDPYLVYRHRGKTGWVRTPADGGARRVAGSPFGLLEKLVRSFRAPAFSDLPRFFGGAVGYFGYDLVRWLEKLPSGNKNDLKLPDCHFLFCGLVLIFDHVRHTLRVVVNSFPGASPRQAYGQAFEKIEKVMSVLNTCAGESVQSLSNCGSCRHNSGRPCSPVNSNLTRADFIAGVQKAKEYIRKGEILQVVLSQRFCRPFPGDPFLAYRRLRAVNPSPYLYFLNFGDVAVVGSSPEMLVRVEGRDVETRPIAGTRPRGRSAADDAELARDLLSDPKEKAEHIMLVDLGRNDLGRICETGSISVPQFLTVEKYSHVMHLVSSVKGRLAPGYTAFDALKACFPAGTVTGAPKVRAMEIIEELEPTRRGPYAGAVGYVGFNGNLDTAITIRTVVFHRGCAYVQAGAGIVADSDPAKEYAETVNKARPLLEILHE